MPGEDLARRLIPQIPTVLTTPQRAAVAILVLTIVASAPSDRLTSSRRHPPPPCTIQKLLAMSLPRSSYDPRRVCLNPFPALNLGKHRRTFGVYLAGGLVCLPLQTR